jgi:hypothetical protein
MTKFLLPPIELKDENLCEGCPSLDKQYSYASCMFLSRLDVEIGGSQKVIPEFTKCGRGWVDTVSRPSWCPLITIKEEQGEKK